MPAGNFSGRDIAGIIILGLALGVLGASVVSTGLIDVVRNLASPWMVVGNIKAVPIGDQVVITAVRDINRSVTAGRYAVEIFHVEQAAPIRQIHTGSGLGNYEPSEPTVIGPMSLELWAGNRRGLPMQILPALLPGETYLIRTHWCLPKLDDCHGRVDAPDVAFTLPDDWMPPPYGTLVR